MFDLEGSIAVWRRQMLAAGVPAPGPLEELELHMRDEIERQLKLGSTESRAFNFAVQGIGPEHQLAGEFDKIGGREALWLAGSAWVVFVISFFLPAIDFGMRGYECALMVLPWQLDFQLQQAFLEGTNAVLIVFQYALLDFANLFLLVSPVLLFSLRNNVRRLKRLRYWALAAFVLVGALLVESGFSGWRIGFYLWMGSFGAFYLSTHLRLRKMSASRAPKEHYA
jgi:hypothetical protein